MNARDLFNVTAAVGLLYATRPILHARPADVRITRTAVESTTIASAGYMAKKHLLEIEFRSGAIYRYRAVPKEVFLRLMASPSKGSFFSHEIRGNYVFEKVTEETK